MIKNNKIMLMSGYKKCSLCKVTKSFSDFYFSKQKKDGYDSWCKKCKLKNNKKYVQDHLKEKREYRHNYHLKNRDKSLMQSKYNNLQIKYGITSKEYDQLIKSQNYSCKICSADISGKGKSQIDHCHITGRIRGILCRDCNLGLGFFKDSLKTMIAAIEYIDADYIIKSGGQHEK